MLCMLQLRQSQIEKHAGTSGTWAGMKQKEAGHTYKCRKMLLWAPICAQFSR